MNNCFQQQVGLPGVFWADLATLAAGTHVCVSEWVSRLHSRLAAHQHN